MKWLNYVILQQQHFAGILKDQLTIPSLIF